jgi:hypothetical protein
MYSTLVICTTKVTHTRGAVAGIVQSPQKHWINLLEHGPSTHLLPELNTHTELRLRHEYLPHKNNVPCRSNGGSSIPILIVLQVDRRVSGPNVRVLHITESIKTTRQFNWGR